MRAKPPFEGLDLLTTYGMQTDSSDLTGSRKNDSEADGVRGALCVPSTPEGPLCYTFICNVSTS